MFDSFWNTVNLGIIKLVSRAIVIILDPKSTFLASGSNGFDVHVHDLKHIIPGKLVVAVLYKHECII